MTTARTLCLSLPIVVACSNQVAGSSLMTADDGKVEAEGDAMGNLLATGSNTFPELPGGLLVFDRLDATSFAERGYDKAAFLADEKCSASFEVLKRGGRFFARFATTEDCYMGFFRVSKNQRILLNLPGTSEYIEVRPVDARFDRAKRYLKLADGFSPAFRENEYINFSTRAVGAAVSAYLQRVKGMSRADANAFRKEMCFGGVTPTPKECLWPNELHFDEVEVEVPADSVPKIESLAKQTQEALRVSRAVLKSKIGESLTEEILQYSERLATTSRMTDRVEAVINVSNFLSCDVTSAESNCAGLDRNALDRAGVAITDIYAPEWKARAQDAVNATTDREDRVLALFTDSKAEDDENVIKPYFGPAFETYLQLRKLFDANRSLLSIATNVVDPKTGSATGMQFLTLPITAAELAGITLTVDAKGNLLLTHPGKDKNRNLTLDGHRGSVVTFGGLPLIPFDPFSIDQSDASLRMPIPKTSIRATSEGK